jgi:hypothetical protein
MVGNLELHIDAQYFSQQTLNSAIPSLLYFHLQQGKGKDKVKLFLWKL